ncbi:MAG: calcium-binding protein [Bacteroidales bacterium]
MSIKTGDCVIVKAGTKEPETEGFEIGGWQGRVIGTELAFDKVNNLVLIEWDSLTLKQIPGEFIQQSEIDGYDWQVMNLYETDVEKSVPTDKQKDVKKVQDLLSDKHYWPSFGEEGLRITKILEGINPKDELKCMQKWLDYLETELTFPIEATVKESEGYEFVKYGDKVLILSLPNIADLHGVIAAIKLKSGKFQFPLCDMQVTNKKSSNFQLIEDYRFWFANR